MQRSRQLQRKRAFSNKGCGGDDSDSSSPSKKSIRTVLHTFGNALIDLSKSIKRSDDSEDESSSDDDDDNGDINQFNQSNPCLCIDDYYTIPINKNQAVTSLQFDCNIVDLKFNLLYDNTFSQGRVDEQFSHEVYGNIVPDSQAIQYMQMIKNVRWHDCFKYDDIVVQEADSIFKICKNCVLNKSDCMSKYFNNEYEHLYNVITFVLLNYDPSTSLDNNTTTNFYYEMFLFECLVLVDDDYVAGVISNYLRYYGIYAKWYNADQVQSQKILPLFNYIKSKLTLTRQQYIKVDMQKYIESFCKAE